MLLDGLPDRWHSEHWNQLVEDFFPLEVSQLFFFDAEKIRSLAEDETSSQVLGTAVKSLLGLDIAERLIADAAVLETQLAKGSWSRPSNADDRAELERRDRAARQVELATLRTERSELENLRLRIKDEAAAARGGVRGGGRPALGGSRRPRAAGQKELEKQISECESRLVALAATELPLCLVDDLLERSSGRTSGSEQAAEVEVDPAAARRSGTTACWPCSPRRRLRPTS